MHMHECTCTWLHKPGLRTRRIRQAQNTVNPATLTKRASLGQLPSHQQKLTGPHTSFRISHGGSQSPMRAVAAASGLTE